MARHSKFHPIAGLKRLIGILPDSLQKSAQDTLNRIVNGVETLHNAFQPQPGENLNSAAYAQRVTDQIIYQ